MLVNYVAALSFEPTRLSLVTAQVTHHFMLDQEKKRDMAKIIDLTNKTFERREKCISEMGALKSQVRFLQQPAGIVPCASDATRALHFSLIQRCHNQDFDPV